MKKEKKERKKGRKKAKRDALNLEKLIIPIVNFTRVGVAHQSAAVQDCAENRIYSRKATEFHRCNQ